MSTSTRQKDLKQPKGIEFLFNVYRHFPGTFLVEILYEEAHLATTVVSVLDWMDQTSRCDIMNSIGLYLRDNVLKPGKEVKNGF